MIIGKFSAYAVQFCNAAKTGIQKGTKYVRRETKNLFVNHTQIGRRLRDGVYDAREAVRIKMPKIPSKVKKYIEIAEERAFSNEGVKASQNLLNDKNFMKLYEEYFSLRFPDKSIYLDNLDDAKIIQEIIESSGVGPTKIAQMISDNKDIMTMIAEKYGSQSELIKALHQTKANCSPSRTLAEAQEVINRAFPEQKLTLIQKPASSGKPAAFGRDAVDAAPAVDQLGVGSVGEAYLAKKADGTVVVIKMIKQGVDKKQLEMEERLFGRIIKEFASPKEYAKIQARMKELYRDWAKELNLKAEAQYNKMLAKGAKRFKVASVIDVAKDGSCLVMEKANGIEAKKLIQMLKDYRIDPETFKTFYANEIAKYPWLNNPEKVIKELPKSIMKTFVEQFMFVKKGGKVLMHGDPHSGNFFMTVNKKGQIIPEFIDTGNCIAKSGAQVKDDISFFANYLVGNSRGIADYLVKQSGYNRANKELITRKITKEIQETLFGVKQNISDFPNIQEHFENIIKKHGLQISPENSTAMKAQIQFFSNISEANKLSGRSIDILELMKDIPQASWSLMKTGINPCSSIKDAIKFAFYNQKQATGTACQFVIKKDVDEILKTHGSLVTIA